MLEIDCLRENKQDFENHLPTYLANDIEAYIKGLEEDSSILDCLWSELHSSINIALDNDRVITESEAEYLRKRYLNN